MSMVIDMRRRGIILLIVAAILTGCSSGGQTASPPPTQTPAITALSSAMPTATVEPAAMPTSAPTATPTAESKPINEAQWRELFRADYTGDGVEEVYEALESAVAAQDDFNDDYLRANALTIGGLRVTQAGAQGEAILLVVDSDGIHAGGESLAVFGPGDRPAAFRLAFDPGSSYLISLLPLRADGRQHSAMLPINWYGHLNAFGLAPRPE